MGEHFIGSQGLQLTVVLRRRRRRRRRSSRGGGGGGGGGGRRRKRRRRKPVTVSFAATKKRFRDKRREDKIFCTKIQITELCETLHSTQIILGKCDRSSSYSSSLLSFH
jgi:hypothetical protein